MSTHRPTRGDTHTSPHEDAEPARAIQRRLEDAGFRVWIDERARAGDSLIAAIATAILEMERTIPVWV